MKILQINYFSPNKNSMLYYKVGEKEVYKIEEHSARGEGDKWYYDVHFNTSPKMFRLFEFHSVIFDD